MKGEVKMRLLVVAVVILLLLTVAAGWRPLGRQKPATSDIVQPADCGNDVYEFNSAGVCSEYARAVSAFKTAHPELRCTTEGLDQWRHLLNCYAQDVDMAIPAQDVNVP